jgi:DNA ligase D-like protein (predicted 3'-phosphoesterase)
MSQEISESLCEDIIKKYDKKKLKRPVYVIQEHHAKRLHWDLRFEFDNVLKSWALPKSPPTVVSEKRLAVAVDDHPLEYALFEGIIPEGNYGAGQVKTWDIGTFDIKEKESKKIIFNIHGKKLKGNYCLLHFRPAEKNWLFFKIKDDKETL